ncbi:hypothetical protein GCM10009634_76370 [Saccharothrix xinjiangensis]
MGVRTRAGGYAEDCGRGGGSARVGEGPEALGRGIEVADMTERSGDERARGSEGGEPADDGTGASAGISRRDEAKPAAEQEEAPGEPDWSLPA